MLRPAAVLSLFLSLGAFAGTAAPPESPSWTELRARAASEKKPLVIQFRTDDCVRCDEFESATVRHPAIQRRLDSVIIATLPASGDDARLLWRSNSAGIALFDRTGTLRARWPFVPDTGNFVVMVDSIIAATPDLDRALALTAAGKEGDAEVVLASVLARLGFGSDARAMLQRAKGSTSLETRQSAVIGLALLDLSERTASALLAELKQIAAAAATPRVGLEAWMTIGSIQAIAGAPDEALRAFETALSASADFPDIHAAAERAVTTIRNRSKALPVIALLPLSRQVISGRQMVTTRVTSAAVGRVSFSLDGREIRRVDRPPFAASIDFGRVPERRVIRAEAFDRSGKSLGVAERIVNDGGETFFVRLLEPREGNLSGEVSVKMDVRIPIGHDVRKVTVSWNDAERATILAAPWVTRVTIPTGSIGVLRVVADLDDGRSSEDAVLLNTSGASDRADVHLVQLPITAMSSKGKDADIKAEAITVREGNRRRKVESIATASDTPLTIGLLIDVSASMHKTLPDAQEAAIRFLETTLGPRDRAFLITFDSRARVVQPPTSDVALLRDQITKLRADGLTAVHDAIILGLLQLEGIKGRRALVVFSDGVDRTSLYDGEQVREMARRGGVPIHLIASLAGIPAGQAADSSRGYGALLALGFLDRELVQAARSTGGTSHTLDNLARLPEVYARIRAALNSQILAFIRTEPAKKENDWRAVQVDVAGEGLEVYAPDGYYAIW